MSSHCACLEVVRGVDAGANVALDERVRIVGRSRDADLVLTDRAVSRRHLEVAATVDGVILTVCDGAQPLVVRGRSLTRWEARPGERLLIGNTELAVRLADAPRAWHVSNDGETTDLQSLLGGASDDARALAGLFGLVESLHDAATVGDVLAVLSRWAQEHTGAVEAGLLGAAHVAVDPSLAPLLARPDEVAVRAVADGHETLVLVPLYAAAPQAIAFRLAVRTDAVTLDTRRLLAVAARVGASTLAWIHAMERVHEENSELRELAVGSARAFLGDSPAAARIQRLVPKLAASAACVLLLGESGTGKTFLARVLHESGPRAREALRIVNCAAIPEHLLESELFGHERGAFTGAVSARPGVFEAAGDGTVLLDEIGELPLTSQAKLLRVIEDKRFERIGSNRSIALRARVLAATNRDLGAMVRAGQFRQDLFFRISVVNVHLPALRERGEDVLVLAERILADLARSAGRRVGGFTPAAREAILRHDWPGNVRELRNAIEHALVLGDGPLVDAHDLPGAAADTERPPPSGDVVRLPASLAWLEERAIEAALRATGGNRARAAALLGINRVTLYKKLRPGA